MFAIASSTVTSWGMYILLPIFIAFLFFIIWDLSKQSNAGRAGTFWMFLALGAGFIGFILKVLIEMAFKRWFIWPASLCHPQPASAIYLQLRLPVSAQDTLLCFYFHQYGPKNQPTNDTSSIRFCAAPQST